MEKHTQNKTAETVDRFNLLAAIAEEIRTSNPEDIEKTFLQGFADNCLSLAEATNRNETVKDIDDLMERAFQLDAISLHFPLFVSMAYGIDFRRLLKDVLENGKFIYRTEA